MCTATLIPQPDGIRFAFNRDESPLRPAGQPPQAQRFGSRNALLPIDPLSQGTWIAVSDAGLVLALLNHTPTPPPGARFDASRGVIIPSLLDCDDLTCVVERVHDLARQRFAPFRLLVMDRCRIVELACRDGDVKMIEQDVDRPRMFTSSGLGEVVVRPPRQQLFDEMLQSDWARQQDAFHRHSWPDRGEVSVSMRRDRARTVSHTLVELTQASATMTYHPQAPDEPGPCFQLSLLMRQPQACSAANDAPCSLAAPRAES